VFNGFWGFYKELAMPRTLGTFEFVGGSVVSLRKQLDLSQNQLARKLDCSTDVVRAWENGRSAPSGPFVEAMMRMCTDGVEIQEFFRHKVD
jgi:DNA-binding transcriptional regulator YiaG